ncbi:MAG: hypothetical protein KGJ93_05680, partial [Patescibacteria group bacterium]|nr:hypothetical protein [Patescibacteria group bacterium]
MKIAKIYGLIASVFISMLFFGAPKAFAYNPVLSVYNSGSGVVVSISGANPSSSVALSYTPSGSSLATTINNFGTTDYSGNFTTTVSSSSYGLAGASQIYVTVGGQQSNSVTVSNYGGGYYGNCGYYGCPVGGLTLSQTSVNLNVGQTAYVTASMPIYNPSFYISSNSNSGVVSASVSGSQISLYGLGSGSSTVTVC